tara:strand:+ start:19194 stop:19784 length:591 start_codon:yes stop_codon:yes gene_type:complete
MLLPLVVFPIFFIVLPPLFDLASIRLGQVDSVQAVNVFFTALIDPIKGIQYGELLAKEVALPLGLPFILLNGLLVGLFLWENETEKTTISKFPLFKQLKEVTTGTKDQAGIISLIPVVRNLKIARFVNPFISPLEKLYYSIFPKEETPTAPKPRPKPITSTPSQEATNSESSTNPKPRPPPIGTPVPKEDTSEESK